jgi:hypothetical protein
VQYIIGGLLVRGILSRGLLSRGLCPGGSKYKLFWKCRYIRFRGAELSIRLDENRGTKKSF